MSHGKIHWLYTFADENPRDEQSRIKHGIERGITEGCKVIMVRDRGTGNQVMVARYLLEKIRDLIGDGELGATYRDVKEYCEAFYKKQEEDDRRMRYELAMKAIFERKLEQIRTLVRQKLNRRNPGMKVPEWIINNYKPRK